MTDSQLKEKATEAMSGVELLTSLGYSLTPDFYDEEQRALDDRDELHDICESHHNNYLNSFGEL